MNSRNSRITFFIVSLAFFLSGGCGLVYEVLWSRYLAELMGSTSLSQLVVLIVFMGGLALGAMLVGRIVDQRDNGLACYGWLELGIGSYALLFPGLFKKTAGLFNLLAAGQLPGSVSLLSVKITWAVLLIALPAIAMGGTLPAVTRYLTKSHLELRRNISLLYGINCLGAVLGALAGGFYLVHCFGMDHSMLYTGFLNLLLGLGALGWGWAGDYRRPSTAAEAIPQRRLEDQLDSQPQRPCAIKRAILAAGVSGLGAMALQVAWIRYFAIVLGATHSSFTIVVAAFIFGIGLGALLVSSRGVGRIPLPTVLAGAFALTAATMGLGLFAYGRIPFEITRLLAIIAPSPFAWPFYELLKFGVCFVLMLLPTMASGMILPVCVRIGGQSGDRVGRDVAMVYAVNTIGSLLGVVITGQVFFRLLTLPRTFQAIFFVYLAMAIFLAFVLAGKGRKRLMAAGVILLVSHLAFWRPWSPELLHGSILEFTGKKVVKYGDFLELNEQLRVVEDRQGPDVQVTVGDVFTDKNPFRTMFINGKPDASNEVGGPDMVTQVLLGQLPMLLHPGARNAFVLGLGSGITSGEILKFPGVEKVTTVELAAEVFEASKTFAADNGRYWQNPRHRMVIEDGKTFLELSKDKFDVIAMEPTNVWQEGMAGLFSEDFFKLVKSRLADGGVVAQWLHIYGVDDQTFNIVVKTFSMVFPEASVFEVGAGDVLLVGYNNNWQFNPLLLERRFYLPPIATAQNSVGVVNPLALLLREVMGRKSFREYTTVLAAPVNTANFPVLEQAAEYGHFIKEPVTVLKAFDSRINSDAKDLLIHDYFRRVGVEPAQLKAAVDSMEAGKNDKLRNSLLFLLPGADNADKAGVTTKEIVKYIDDPQLHAILMDPSYGMAPDMMSVEDAYNLLGAELLLWKKVATQFWAPDPGRLLQLYDRYARGVARQSGARTALDVAVSLAEGGACRAALPFFRISEGKWEAAEGKEAVEITTAFSCESRVGDAAKARGLWKLIEQYEIPVTESLVADQAALEIKMGGQPPPPVYGKLPSRK